MKKAVFIGLGGAAGTITRYALFQIPFSSAYRPIVTLLINGSGSFLLGFLIILFSKRLRVSAEIRLSLTTGFLGGYTTFSTFCKDTVLLLFSGKPLYAVLYAALSVILGLCAAWFGIVAAKRLERGKA